MTTVNNKTRKALRVPLPRGKVLFLGPGKSGQIASEAADHPQVKAMIASGEIEIVGEGPAPTARGGRVGKGRGPMLGHASGGEARRTGDR